MWRQRSLAKVANLRFATYVNPPLKILKYYTLENSVYSNHKCDCCCWVHLSSCHRTASDAGYWKIRALLIGRIGETHTCLGVSGDQIFQWISWIYFPLNLLVQNHQATMIIVKRLIQGSNNVTRVRVEPRSCNQGSHENEVFKFSQSRSWLSTATVTKLFYAT